MTKKDTLILGEGESLKQIKEESEAGFDFEDIEDIENTEQFVEMNKDESSVSSETTNNKDSCKDFRKCLHGLFFCLLILVFVLCGLHLYKSEEEVVWIDSVVEYGTKIDNPIKNKGPYDELLSVSQIDTYSLGKQKVVAIFYDGGKEVSLEKTFKVVDTKAPVVTVSKEEVRVKVGGTLDLDELNIQATDEVDGDVTYYVKTMDYSSIGESAALIVAKDFNGNTTEKEIKVHVIGKNDKDSLENYRQNVARIEEEYKEQEKRRKEAEKKEKEKKAAKDKESKNNKEIESRRAKVFWVGDVSVSSIKDSVSGSSDDVWVTTDWGNYDWFSNTAVNEVSKSANKGDTIIISMGVNGFGSDRYVTKINELSSSDWKDLNVVFVSISPIDDNKAQTSGYLATDSQVQMFNRKMREGLEGVSFIDTYSMLKGDISKRTTDGVLLDSETNQMLYSYLVGGC